jgi:hypothetical protein
MRPCGRVSLHSNLRGQGSTNEKTGKDALLQNVPEVVHVPISQDMPGGA